MATNASDKNRTAIRPATIVLGTDATGADHIYRTRAETIHVVEPGVGRTHTEDVENRSIDEWMAFVEDRRGWDKRQYGGGLAGIVMRALDQ